MYKGLYLFVSAVLSVYYSFYFPYKTLLPTFAILQLYHILVFHSLYILYILFVCIFAVLSECYRSYPSQIVLQFIINDCGYLSTTFWLGQLFYKAISPSNRQCFLLIILPRRFLILSINQVLSPISLYFCGSDESFVISTILVILLLLFCLDNCPT